MITRECSGGGHPAGWRGADGKLWFSTIKGVAMIDPENIKLNDQPPQVAIEEIRVDDESINPSQTIELSPGKSRLDFYYTDRKSTRLNSSHGYISYAVFCLKKKNRI